MGDLSTEPSMEDILSSIKRIIAEEGDQPARRARPARAAPAVPIDDAEGDEVLELSDPMPSPRGEPSPREAAWPRDPVPSPRADEPSTIGDPIVSNEAAAASRSALESLSRMLMKPEPGNDGTLEGLVREMLRPLLREWLDANLPDLVEKMVSREIARIARQAG